MSYVSRNAEQLRNDKFKELKDMEDRISIRLQSWVDEATTLNTGSPTQAEKDDVLAMRASFIASIRSIFQI